MPKISRAIISVTDKSNLVEFCQGLKKHQIEILSTGGTAKILRDNNIEVVDVSEYTNSPEILDGRLKTLHPKIEGGILGIRSNDQHQKEMKEEGILPIDLVVVNLYEFEKTIAKDGITLEEAIENIDIGGPTMLRAAAKNYQDVTVVVDINDYNQILEELDKNGEISKETNFKLAVKVFQTTNQYDQAISHYLTNQLNSNEDYPEKLSLQFEKKQSLRYGENPHQSASLYQELPATKGSLITAEKLHGKELSFNNMIDLEGALATVREFKEEPACVIIKHTNPCGVAISDTLHDAFLKAKASDPTSAFGGIIGLNKKVDLKTAEAIGETFFECIIAPDYEKDALEKLTAKKNIRLLKLDPFYPETNELDFKRVEGGLLVQEKDVDLVKKEDLKIVSKRQPTNEEIQELMFAWKVCKHVKSNAIVYTKNQQVLGVGAGQMSRIDSSKVAASKSNQPLEGSVIASDAFFPFRDGVDEAAKHGITAVIQPGGSVRDEEVIKACDEHNLALVFTGMRHFRH
jgi:phosphoribosylaminoimidazolecarboxamide formyltransferase/IMP cyclohydrolase